MIATVTLNPAVDKTIRTSRVIMGTVNRADEVKNMAGGKGINVAKVLRQYGYEVKAFGFVGGYTGSLIEDSMQKSGVHCAFTHIKKETRTSINVLSEDGYVTEFLEPGPEISKEELAEFLKGFESGIKDCELIVLSGSVPKGIPADIYSQLIGIAGNMGKRVLLDASGEALKKGMYARPFMMKPNIRELESLEGKRLASTEDIKEAAIKAVEWGVKNVMVSMGSKGILYALRPSGDAEIKTLFVKAPRVKTVNTVGSGDCAVAAFAMAVSEGKTFEDIIKDCVAISAANTLSMENGMIPKERANELLSELSVTEL